ncbi:MAG: YveK family protein [Enterococcus sp.]
MEEIIGIKEIVAILKKHFIKIFLITCFTTFLAGIITNKVIEPVYSSSAELIVQSNKSDSSSLQDDINGNILLINTYKDMIMGNLVMEKVQNQLQDKYDVNTTELKQDIIVEQTDNSQMFKISATAEDAQKVADIANTTAKVFKDTVKDVVDVAKVTVTSEAEVPADPISPNKKVNLTIGIILGLLIGTTSAFVTYFLDSSIKNNHLVVEELNLPLLGNVTERTRGKK